MRNFNVFKSIRLSQLDSADAGLDVYSTSYHSSSSW